MTAVPFATSSDDSRALELIDQRHGELVGVLTARTSILRAAVQAAEDWRTQRDAIVEWCQAELLAHLDAVMAMSSAAAQDLPRLELLLRSMLHEQALLEGLVARLRAANDDSAALMAAGALQAVLESHLAKHSELLLPALAGEPSSSVAQLLEAMPALSSVGDEAEPRTPVTMSTGEPPATPDPSACGCHDDGSAATPELDARTIPHAIRHATVFGALDAIQDGATLDLLAPHDPIPLLAQIEQRSPQTFEVDYLESGPDTWRLRFSRRRVASPSG